MLFLLIFTGEKNEGRECKLNLPKVFQEKSWQCQNLNPDNPIPDPKPRLLNTRFYCLPTCYYLFTIWSLLLLALEQGF